MKHTLLTNGDLELQLEGPGEFRAAKQLARGYPGTIVAENAFIRRFLRPGGYHQVKPEDVGALTDAPLIQDRHGSVWGFMDYQVTAFLQRLIKGAPVTWQHGGKTETKHE